MKTLLKNLITLLAVGTLSGVLCPQAQAVPIQGDIDFGGVVTFDTTSLATATRINLWNSSFVLQSTGDFDTFINPGDTSTMAAPWIFTPSTPTPSLWSVGGFKFDLSSSVVVSQNANFLNITGAGTLSGNGFDPTPGLWAFTSSNSSGSNRATFGFQANSAPVPEVGTVSLLVLGGFALAGTHLLRRKRKGA